jgi:hypothetical protein
MSIFLVTLSYLVVFSALVIGLVVTGLLFTYNLLILLALHALVSFGLLRCPRCGDYTLTWRIPGSGKSIFGAVFLIMPPWRCGTCKLDFHRNRFGQIVKP